MRVTKLVRPIESAHALRHHPCEIKTPSARIRAALHDSRKFGIESDAEMFKVTLKCLLRSQRRRFLHMKSLKKKRHTLGRRPPFHWADVAPGVEPFSACAQHSLRLERRANRRQTIRFFKHVTGVESLTQQSLAVRLGFRRQRVVQIDQNVVVLVRHRRGLGRFP